LSERSERAKGWVKKEVVRDEEFFESKNPQSLSALGTIPGSREVAEKFFTNFAASRE